MNRSRLQKCLAWFFLIVLYGSTLAIVIVGLSKGLVGAGSLLGLMLSIPITLLMVKCLDIVFGV